MIGVILPTRGLVFTEVEDAIDRELEGYPYKIYRSFTLPIPDCQNELVEKALAEYNSHLLFIEEDVVIPEGGFEKLMLAKADIACIDYGVEGWGCVTKNKEGEILWCGLGCTLINRNVFNNLDKPYFRSDIELRLNDWKWVKSPPDKYGGQDIYFCTKAREKGFKIVQVEGIECKHLKLESLGQPGLNNGLHKIVEKPKITKQQIV
jgi:hypothetical protein